MNEINFEDLLDEDLPTVSVPRTDAGLMLYQICKLYTELQENNDTEERIKIYRELRKGSRWLTKRFNKIVNLYSENEVGI